MTGPTQTTVPEPDKEVGVSDPPAPDKPKRAKLPPPGPDWGFIDEDGTFVAIPKIPLWQAEKEPPCTVTLYNGPRHIIIDPNPKKEITSDV